MGSSIFYHDEPLFGMDIGHSNIKVMQLDAENKKVPVVLGYGSADFPAGAVSNGVIANFEAVGHALHTLFESHLVGKISTKRIACSIPTAKTFSRPMTLPPMSDKDILEAVKLEAEQYIPVPLANLYLDYDVARQDDKGIELLMVATPRNIIDSYIKLLDSVGLIPVSLEPTMNGSSRFFGLVDQAQNQPSVLIDLGSEAIDLAVFDQKIFVNNTVGGGNNNMTNLIAEALSVDPTQAYSIKNTYGISVSDKQPEIRQALAPILDNLVHEVRKIVRYYNERISVSRHKIVQVITLGGGATMPGLNEYLSLQLELPSHSLDPTRQLNFGSLAPIPEETRPVFVTVAGEALLNPRTILT